MIPKNKITEATIDKQSVTDKAALASLPATGAHQDKLTSIVIGRSVIHLIGLAIKFIIYNSLLGLMAKIKCSIAG